MKPAGNQLGLCSSVVDIVKAKGVEELFEGERSAACSRGGVGGFKLQLIKIFLHLAAANILRVFQKGIKSTKLTLAKSN
jgi:hypothetical protein